MWEYLLYFARVIKNICWLLLGNMAVLFRLESNSIENNYTAIIGVKKYL